MMSAELVVKIGILSRKIEEASAKGFRNKAAMDLLYSLETAVDALLSVATAEYLAAEGKS
jgi:hypothetical protein